MSKPERQNICVITSARSGSNWLLTLLRSHPGVHCHNEIFHRRLIGSTFHLRKFGPLRSLALLTARNIRPVAFLDRVIDRTRREYPERPVVVFKLFWYHNKRVLRHVTDNPDYRLIYLFRRDKLAQFSSRKIALKTSHWVKPNQPEKEMKVRFRMAEFARYVERQERGENFSRMLAPESQRFCMDYEDINARLGDLFDWLGLDPSELVGSGGDVTRKQNPDNVLERFSNPEEVVQQLSGTRWERYLHT